MERAVGSFVKHQNETEDTFRKWEEERWEKEIEFQEKRRREDREHELRLFQMLGQMSKPWESRVLTTTTLDHYLDTQPTILHHHTTSITHVATTISDQYTSC